MSTSDQAPVIIIKRKKVIQGGGHHGGAWKVAYADFVTAMMAFFMLMWLLNATTEQQRQGIADYFSPTIAISRVSGGGDGMFGGDNITSQDVLTQTGNGASQAHSGRDAVTSSTPDDEDALANEIAQVKALEKVEETLLGRGGESTVSEQALRHIVTRVTDEGLIIEIFDVPGAKLFEAETDKPNPVTIEIAAMLARTLDLVQNPIAINAHLSAQSIVRRNNSVWDLSMGRATQMRLMLEEGGFTPKRIARMTGEGDRDPVTRDSTADRNNRIEVIVLRSDR